MKIEEATTATLLVVAILVSTGLGYLIGSQNARVVPSTYTTASTATPTTTPTTTVVSTVPSTATFANPVILNYSSIPAQFFVGNYSISVTQGTGYNTIQLGDYTYSGFFTTFSVFPLTGGQATDFPFFWNTTSGPSTSHLPYDARCYTFQSDVDACPNSTTSFVGTTGILEIAWTNRSSTIWVSFTFGSY